MIEDVVALNAELDGAAGFAEAEGAPESAVPVPDGKAGNGVARGVTERARQQEW